MKENNISTSQKKIYSYFERNPELKVLFIFSDPFLKLELGEMTWKEGYRYVVFKGDWFTCKYLLDKEWQDDKVVFYFDMASPLQEKKVREKFPLMDVLVANAEFHHEDYIAFMQQYNLPTNMSVFVEKNVMLLQTNKMLSMLESYYADGNINEDVATRAILSMFLSKQKVLGWDEILILVLLQGRDSERKKQADFYRKIQGSKMSLESLNKHFEDIFGEGIDINTETKVEKIVQVFKYNAIVQGLSPVDADNYKAKRINNSMALQRMNTILELIASQPKYASAFEELIKELGVSIRCEEIVKWYGAESNFYYIPEDLCVLILRNIVMNISDNPKIVIDRVRYLMTTRSEESFLANLMDFILRVACYYDKVDSIVSTKLQTPNDYIVFYENEFWQIDQLYRHALELFYQVNPSDSLFEDIQSVKGSLDIHYAKIANRINLNWSDSLKVAGGLKSLNKTRQWDFYVSVVKPIQKKVAVIVCDALRYEMAQELTEELGKSKHIAKLYSAIATLPTETKYCKPSLLPYKTLKLYNGDDTEMNMLVDDKILGDTDKRSSHLKSYKDSAMCVPFETIAVYNQERNREIFKHTIVYIFHDDIDEIGHSNSAKQIVSGCSQSIRDIATMIPKIHATYNVTEVIVTSDHGFLFNDMSFEEKDKHKVTEVTLEQKSRYFLTKSEDEVQGVMKFPLGEVSGMCNANDVKVAVPLGTNRFAAPSGGYMFAHGGASLQELIIPVIVSRLERTDNKEPVGVTILDRRLSVQASRIRFQLLQTEAVGMDTKERIVSVALYHNDAAVTPIKQIRLDKTDPSLDNRRIAVDLTLNKNVDAKVLQLKVFDIEDENNPLVKENVTNNTLIENDFDF